MGEVEYFTGYAWTVYDCDACGCRYTQHDSTVHDLLHKSGAIPYYEEYREMAGECKRLFDKGDSSGLRCFLAQTSKYRYILDEVERAPGANLLEVGCSRGYLTSYFILRGQSILGIDVSAEAVEGARVAFGNHFALADSPEVLACAPYDIIYHVGLIGCVKDPVGMTKELLGLLKPGGRLFFNAPNRAALGRGDALWLDSAPPPDLVTLYPSGFWRRQFAALAQVSESIEYCDPRLNLRLGLRSLLGRRWRKSDPLAMSESRSLLRRPPRTGDRLWNLFERGVAKAARFTRLDRLAPPRPAEFGLFVSMKKDPVSALLRQ